MAGDRADAGTSVGGAVNSLRKLVRSRFSRLEEEDSPSDTKRGVLGLIAVDIGLTDTGGSGKGHEGGGEIGGNDFLEIIRGGLVYIKKGH